MALHDINATTLAEVAAECNMPVAQIEDVYPCLPQQIDFISENQYEVFHVVLSCASQLEMDRWCEAVRRVVSQNSIFRTRLSTSHSGIVQVISNVEHITEQRSGDVQQYLDDEEHQHLGLGKPLFRSVVIGNKFVATLHHAIMDHWSLNSFLKEDVPLVYLGHPPKERAPFKDLVTLCTSVDRSAAKSFWASRFKGHPAVFPKVPMSNSSHSSVMVKRKIVLKRITNGVSPSQISSIAEAAWALTASTYAGSDSVAYGLVLSGRSPGLKGTETTLGPTVVWVPVQVHVQRHMNVEGLIKDRAISLRQLTTNPMFLQYGVANISAVSEAARAASGFQSSINIVPPQPITLPATREETKSIRLDRIIKQSRASFGLMLYCKIQGDDEILLETMYDPTVLCERQLQRVLDQFEHTIQLLVEAPLSTKLNRLQRLNLHDGQEIHEWNRNMPTTVDETIHGLFSTQAQAQPDAVAIEHSAGRVTYYELDRMSTRLSHELRRLGVLPGHHVVIISGKSVWAIVAALAVLKAGGVCFPIDEGIPQDQKAATIASSSVKVILTSTLHHATLTDLTHDILIIDTETIADLPKVEDPLDIGLSSPDHSAYMFSNGGLPGTSKVVKYQHRGLASLLITLAKRVEWQPGCRMLQYATYASISSILEIFGTLLFGGCLCMPSEEELESDLPTFIVTAKVNWAVLPSHMVCNMSPTEMPGLSSLLSIGSPVDVKTLETWGRALRLYCGWGEPEVSILSTVGVQTPGQSPPDSIGRSIGCAIWIVDPRNTDELVPIGAIGELLIESEGLTKTCLDDEARKRTSCIAPPLWASSCDRRCTLFYRTRHLGRYDLNGGISYVGKQDNRVKLSNQILQLEDLERTICGCASVRDTVMLTRIAAGRTQLVAVVCLADSRLPRKTVLRKLPCIYAEIVDKCLDEVRIFARSTLSPDTVPSLWMVVEQLPRTITGHLDRATICHWLKNNMSISPNH